MWFLYKTWLALEAHTSSFPCSLLCPEEIANYRCVHLMIFYFWWQLPSRTPPILIGRFFCDLPCQLHLLLRTVDFPLLFLFNSEIATDLFSFALKHISYIFTKDLIKTFDFFQN